MTQCFGIWRLALMPFGQRGIYAFFTHISVGTGSYLADYSRPDALRPETWRSQRVQQAKSRGHIPVYGRWTVRLDHIHDYEQWVTR